MQKERHLKKIAELKQRVADIPLIYAGVRTERSLCRMTNNLNRRVSYYTVLLQRSEEEICDIELQLSDVREQIERKYNQTPDSE